MLSDLRHGARLLLKDRWFTLAAVCTLALGIAATNTVFTIVNADLALTDLQPIERHIAAERWEQRFAGSLFSIIAVVALLLALVGLYAVTAYAAAQQTKELGVRLALGAPWRSLWWTVVHRAAWQVAAGLALGLAGGVAMSRVLPSRLAGTVGNDPLTFAVIAVMLVGTTLLASSLPARRAMHLDPVAALRSE